MRNKTKQRLARKRGSDGIKLFDALARVVRPSDDQVLYSRIFLDQKRNVYHRQWSVQISSQQQC